MRELENAIERAVVLCQDGRVRSRDLPATVSPQSASGEAYLRIPLGTTLREAEDQLIEQALELCRGDKHRAARLLGISTRTITRHQNRRSAV
jgi:DNA-binding NtrC family response regulator